MAVTQFSDCIFRIKSAESIDSARQMAEKISQRKTNGIGVEVCSRDVWEIGFEIKTSA
jgi:hypothetical protein